MSKEISEKEKQELVCAMHFYCRTCEHCGQERVLIWWKSYWG